MKIALIGYGKMGKMIDQLSHAQGIDVVARVASDAAELNAEKIKDAQVCLDFSHPDAVLEHIGQVCALKRDLVIGTTGWEEHLDAVRALVEESGIGAIYSSNFSIGMQVFIRLVKEAGHLLNRVGGYDVGGLEVHHRQKADSPSGTALELISQLLKEMKDKKKPIFGALDREILPHELQFAALRCGSEPGRHTVFFDSAADTIELNHRARNREGFARGALIAALWVHGKKGLFTMNDLIETLINGGAVK